MVKHNQPQGVRALRSRSSVPRRNSLDLAYVLVPLVFFSASFLLGGRLLVLAGSGGIFDLTGIALIVTLLIEAISLWFLIWALLAKLSTLEMLPTSLRRRLRQTVASFGTASAKRVASGTLATTVMAGTALVGPAALADDLTISPDDLLWETSLVQTQAEFSDPDSYGTESESETVQEVWLPGTVPGYPDVAEPTQAEDANIGAASEPQGKPTAAEPEANAAAEAQLPAVAEVGAGAAPGINSPAIVEEPATETGGGRPAPAPAKRALDIGLTAVSATRLDQGTRIAAPIGDPENVPATSPIQDTVYRANVYTVTEGDCLWNIAKAHLPAGTSDAQIDDAWQRIYRLNVEVIGENPDLIIPGQQVELPDLGQL